MILVDSSVWIDYFKGTITAQTERLDGLLGYEPLAIGDLILTEVLQGFDNERDFNDARKMLTSLMVVELGGQEIAIQAARNFRSAAQDGCNGSQDHRYDDCNPVHRERIRAVAQRPGFRSVRQAPRSAGGRLTTPLS